MRNIPLPIASMLALVEAGAVLSYGGYKMPKPRKQLHDDAIQSLEKMEKAQAKRQRRANKLLGIK